MTIAELCRRRERVRLAKQIVHEVATGERSVFEDKGGYTTVRCRPYNEAAGLAANGLVGFHRIVWEAFNGVPVPKGHDVHHKDGDRTRNVPENLECKAIHPRGQDPEDKTDWVTDFVVTWSSLFTQPQRDAMCEALGKNSEESATQA